MKNSLLALAFSGIAFAQDQPPLPPSQDQPPGSGSDLSLRRLLQTVDGAGLATARIRPPANQQQAPVQGGYQGGYSSTVPLRHLSRPGLSSLLPFPALLNASGWHLAHRADHEPHLHRS